MEELAQVLKDLGQPAFRAKQIFEWMHVKLADSYDAMTNLSKDLRESLKEKYPLTVLDPWIPYIPKRMEP
jgi:23S rRNA (adenine2503-C2)-methyltransferase